VTTEHSQQDDKVEKTARISAEEYREMIDHEAFDTIRKDSNYEAYDRLSQDQRDLIDRADGQLDGWTAGDAYFELNQDRSSDKIRYLRMEVFGLADCDFSEVDFREEDLKEALREWHGMQLTIELRKTRVRESER